MTSNKIIRLGDFIQRSTTNNKDCTYGPEFIVGVTSDGVFAKPKGVVDNVNLKPYKIVNNGAFVYNPSRLDIGSIAYRTEGFCIVSHLYIIFYLNEKGKKTIDPMWLFMYFKRKEFLREVTFRNFGSQRPEFSFDKMSDILIEIPPIEIQRKYVAIYEALLSNFKAYESKLDDLKLVCDGFIDNLKKNSPLKFVGPYIEIKRNKNLNSKINEVYGVSNTLKFITASSTVDRTNLKNYKIVEYEDLAYVPTTHMKIWAVAISDKKNPFVVSPIYEVFGIKDKNQLCPEYLFLWLCREETIRYAFYNSWGSARENFSYDDLCQTKIPLPNIEIQRDIAKIYSVYYERKQINETLKNKISNICPVLIRGSIEEGLKGAN